MENYEVIYNKLLEEIDNLDVEREKLTTELIEKEIIYNNLLSNYINAKNNINADINDCKIKRVNEINKILINSKNIAIAITILIAILSFSTFGLFVSPIFGFCSYIVISLVSRKLLDKKYSNLFKTFNSRINAIENSQGRELTSLSNEKKQLNEVLKSKDYKRNELVMLRNTYGNFLADNENLSIKRKPYVRKK